MAEAEVAKRQVDRVVALGSHQHMNTGRTREPLCVDVPAHLIEYLEPTGGEAGEVRHRATRYEADIRPQGKTEKFQQPRSGSLFKSGHRGRGVAKTRVLIPRAHEPIRTQRGGQRTAHHPAIEAAGSDRHEPRLRTRRQQVDHVARTRTMLRKGTSKDGKEVICARAGCHATCAYRVQPLAGVLTRARQGLLVFVF